MVGFHQFLECRHQHVAHRLVNHPSHGFARYGQANLHRIVTIFAAGGFLLHDDARARFDDRHRRDRAVRRCTGHLHAVVRRSAAEGRAYAKVELGDGGDPFAGVEVRDELMRAMNGLAAEEREAIALLHASLVELTDLNARDRKAGVFQLDLLLSPLKPGFYTCQINVIDDAAGTFGFPRLPLLVRAEKPAISVQPQQ